MNKRKFYVIEKSDCGRCGGSGVISEGFYSQLTDKWDRREFNCPECHGTGDGENRIDLVDALKAIGIDVDAVLNAQRTAQRAADVASMLANGILPD